VDHPAQAEARRTLGRRLRRAAGAASLALLVAASGYAVFRWLAQGDALRIGAIRFHGASRTSEAELLALLPVKVGDSILLADVGAAERALARHAWVKGAEVNRRFPPALEVRVVEREPRALVDLGGLYLVDREARVFKRASPGDGLDLPIITGFARDDYVQRRGDLEPLLAGALALLDAYAAGGLGELAALSEIHVDVDEGLTLYVGEEGTQVRLGIGDLPQKLSRLHRVLASLRAAGRRPEVLHLDNRSHPTWVTLRLAGRREGESGRRLASRVAGKGPRGP
jgi:cell division protein FtsQ